MNPEEAHHIVSAARSRGLGSQPRWRRTGAVLWSAFLGACCTLAAALLAPDYWTTSPLGFDHLTIIFIVAWFISVIPALSASLLASPSEQDSDSGSDSDHHAR
jgi:CHASE2 domain-containing sensor protein